MAYVERIAYHLKRRDEVPNQELAKELAEENNEEGIKEMAGYLFDKNKSVASDCLKVMYEASYIRPEIIVDYYGDFVTLLQSKNNRMVWGAMIAIASIAKVAPDMVYQQVDLILEKINSGTVITNVQGAYALINMAGASEEIYGNVIDQIFTLVGGSRSVEFPKRCEAFSAILKDEDKERLIELIHKHEERLSTGGKKRVARLIRRLEK